MPCLGAPEEQVKVGAMPVSALQPCLDPSYLAQRPSGGFGIATQGPGISHGRGSSRSPEPPSQRISSPLTGLALGSPPTTPIQSTVIPFNSLLGVDFQAGMGALTPHVWVLILC